MVASTITIEPIYLDGREKNVLEGGVSTIEDDTEVHKSESRTVSATPRSDRVQQSWQLSWSTASEFITNLFKICRNEKGFLFISPLEEERAFTSQPLRNTVTDGSTGDGSTTTFQLQLEVSLPYSIGVGSASTEVFDVNYPLQGSVVVYADGTPVTVSSVNLSTGVVTLSSAPANGKVMTADYERAVPVMFTSKSISRTFLQVDHTEVRSAQIEEIM